MASCEHCDGGGRAEPVVLQGQPPLVWLCAECRGLFAAELRALVRRYRLAPRRAAALEELYRDYGGGD